NRPDIIFSIFAKGNSIPSVIANEFTEATYDLYLSALVYLGLVLLLVSVGFSALGRILIFRMSRPRAGWLKSRLLPALRFGEPPSREAQADAETIEKTEAQPHRIAPKGKMARWMDRLMCGAGLGGLKAGLLGVVVIAAAFLAVTRVVDDPAVR